MWVVHAAQIFTKMPKNKKVYLSNFLGGFLVGRLEGVVRGQTPTLKNYSNKLFFFLLTLSRSGPFILNER